MPEDPRNSKELGFQFSLAQIGLEMVTPMGVGIALDYFLNWRPWGTIGGLGVGVICSMTHLILLVNRHESETSKPPGGKQ